MMIAAATACFANSFFLSKKTGEIAICMIPVQVVGGVTCIIRVISKLYNYPYCNANWIINWLSM